jgi:histo-blood group ABO system transferase
MKNIEHRIFYPFLLFFLFPFLFLYSHVEEVASEQPRNKVGLCIMATGRYDKFAQELIDSARPYFCTRSEVTYFVFTDGNITPAEDVVTCFQKRLGWPADTLKRFEVYAQNADLLSGMDYLFAVDADMRFVAAVGEEILSDLVGTQHPGYVGRRGTYEKNPLSTACVPSYEGDIYFAGGFYGGTREAFFKLVETLKERVSKDEESHFIAAWHDESHLNRYFIDHHPTLVLSPAYCYPEKWKFPYPKKLLALDKDHSEIRKP